MVRGFSKRAQEIPLGTIVIAIILILVLVFIVLILGGGFGKFSSTTSSSGPTASQINASICAQYMATLQSQLGSTSLGVDKTFIANVVANSEYYKKECYTISPFTMLVAGYNVYCGID
ncbi:MAG: hypothetical protein ACP5G1_03830, partial [Nanopusillaceae archaeon]